MEKETNINLLKGDELVSNELTIPCGDGTVIVDSEKVTYKDEDLSEVLNKVLSETEYEEDIDVQDTYIFYSHEGDDFIVVETGVIYSGDNYINRVTFNKIVSDEHGKFSLDYSKVLIREEFSCDECREPALYGESYADVWEFLKENVSGDLFTQSEYVAIDF